MTAAALFIAQASFAHSAAPITRAEYETCQARDEQGFRAAIEALTLKGLQEGLANLDYPALVADEWRRGNLEPGDGSAHPIGNLCSPGDSTAGEGGSRGQSR